MSNARIRVVGQLGSGLRGLMLTTPQNEIWVIETDQATDALLGQQVVVDGTISGLDRLRADWLGLQAG